MLVFVTTAGKMAELFWQNATLMPDSDANPYTGSAALAIDGGPIAGVPRVTVAFITGLQDGDKISASLYLHQ